MPNLEYIADLSAGCVLVWIGCRYAAIPYHLAFIPFGLGLMMILGAVLVPNVQAFAEWRRARRQGSSADPQQILVGNHN